MAHVTSWSAADVADWVEQCLQLPCGDVFREADIGGLQLLQEDLASLGLQEAQRCRIETHVAAFRAQLPTPPQPAPQPAPLQPAASAAAQGKVSRVGSPKAPSVEQAQPIRDWRAKWREEDALDTSNGAMAEPISNAVPPVEVPDSHWIPVRHSSREKTPTRSHRSSLGCSDARQRKHPAGVQQAPSRTPRGRPEDLMSYAACAQQLSEAAKPRQSPPPRRPSSSATRANAEPSTGWHAIRPRPPSVRHYANVQDAIRAGESRSSRSSSAVREALKTISKEVKQARPASHAPVRPVPTRADRKHKGCQTTPQAARPAPNGHAEPMSLEKAMTHHSSEEPVSLLVHEKAKPQSSQSRDLTDPAASPVTLEAVTQRGSPSVADSVEKWDLHQKAVPHCGSDADLDEPQEPVSVMHEEAVPYHSSPTEADVAEEPVTALHEKAVTKNPGADLEPVGPWHEKATDHGSPSGAGLVEPVSQSGRGKACDREDVARLLEQIQQGLDCSEIQGVPHEVEEAWRRPSTRNSIGLDMLHMLTRPCEPEPEGAPLEVCGTATTETPTSFSMSPGMLRASQGLARRESPHVYSAYEPSPARYCRDLDMGLHSISAKSSPRSLPLETSEFGHDDRNGAPFTSTSKRAAFPAEDNSPGPAYYEVPVGSHPKGVAFGKAARSTTLDAAARRRALAPPPGYYDPMDRKDGGCAFSGASRWPSAQSEWLQSLETPGPGAYTPRHTPRSNFR
ncbi:unnamed protein product [Effrenium voratum]|nr:unnamed protein product [Effrenium voratum]